MKKVLSVSLVVVLVLSLAGCGDSEPKGKPDYMPQDVYDACVDTAEHIDDYLAGNASADSLSASIEQSDKILTDYAMSMVAGDEGYLDVTSLVSAYAKLNIGLSKLTLASIGSGNEKDAKASFKEARKTMKKVLGS